MGLNHPTDLAAWQRWQSSPARTGWARWAVRRLRSLRPQPVTAVLHHCAPLAQVTSLIVLDSTSITSQRALLDPLRHLDLTQVALIAPEPILDLLPSAPQGRRWDTRSGLMVELIDQLPNVVDLLSIGHFLQLGGLAHQWAVQRGITPFVVQHGLITPMGPPLAPGATWLAWTEADAAFQVGDRRDVRVQVIGSQLLWEARQQPIAVRPDASPVFLGQLHGAELSRRSMSSLIYRFCIANGASYRPHPAECDRTSRAFHRRFADAGIDVDAGAGTAMDSGRPVVSIFSTGVLEAAIRGLPAWVYHPDPPAWLLDFWQRYQMSPFGEAPTNAQALAGSIEPAQALARLLSASAQ